MKRKTIIITMMLLFSIFMTMNTVSADANWEVHVYPENQTVQNGSYVTFQLNATPLVSAEGVGGWEITQLNYTTSYLDLNSVTEGNFLSVLGSTLFNDGTNNDSAGTITDIYCAYLGASNTTTAGNLCTLNFTANGSGTATITFYGLFSCGEDEIAFTAYGGNITISNNTAPEITDNSPASGTTGDSYTFNVSISDDYDELSELTVKVNWSHGENGANDSMNLSGAYFTKTVTLDDSISDLTYHIYANDTYPASNYTSELSATVSDNDDPINGTPDTEDSFTSSDEKVFTIDWCNISVTGTDNIAISNVYLNIPGISNESVTTNLSGTTYYWNSTVSDSYGNFSIFFWMNDTSGNAITTDSIYVRVYPKWDLNQDADVDIVDITSITSQYGSTGDNRWIKQDIAVNGDINIVDITTVTSHYGENYESQIPPVDP